MALGSTLYSHGFAFFLHYFPLLCLLGTFMQRKGRNLNWANMIWSQSWWGAGAVNHTAMSTLVCDQLELVWGEPPEMMLCKDANPKPVIQGYLCMDSGSGVVCQYSPPIVCRCVKARGWFTKNCRLIQLQSRNSWPESFGSSHETQNHHQRHFFFPKFSASSETHTKLTWTPLASLNLTKTRDTK